MKMPLGEARASRAKMQIISSSGRITEGGRMGDDRCITKNYLLSRIQIHTFVYAHAPQHIHFFIFLDLRPMRCDFVSHDNLM